MMGQVEEARAAENTKWMALLLSAGYALEKARLEPGPPDRGPVARAALADGRRRSVFVVCLDLHVAQTIGFCRLRWAYT